jgi:septum formation protein
VSNADESFDAEMPSEKVAMYIAHQKARAIQLLKGNEDRTIVAADTIVVIDNEILGKPIDRNDAVRILQKLSGNKHQVITGVVILQGTNMVEFFDCTEVEFHSLTQEQIEFYIDKYQPYDKAGAYAIQEWIGVIGIRAIKGDFYNVMGLPVSRVVQALQAL